MNNLNIHGRHPKDLPDKETIDDILLELKDTNKFDISWIDLNQIFWRANGKLFDNWAEKGQVVTCEMDSTFPNFNPSEDWSDSIPMSYATVKQTRYDILRHPIRVSVKFKGVLSLNKGAKEIIETSNDVYLRLKDYLGPDVIQDQFDMMNYANVSFDIDFMISDCKVIK
jgi:hypothetical protein